MKRVARIQRRKKKLSHDGREKRRHQRFNVDASVSYKVKSFPPPEKMIKLLDAMRKSPTVDVSSGGLSFVSRQLIIPGSIIEMNVPRSILGPHRRRRARVVWVNEIEEDKYRIGVKFT